MKITKTQLKQIITEELEQVLFKEANHKFYEERSFEEVQGKERQKDAGFRKIT